MLRRTALCGLFAVFLAISPAAFASGPAPTEAGLREKGAKRLSPSDFAALYVGNTLTGTTSDGEPFHVFVESASVYRMQFQGKRTADKWKSGPEGEFCTTADGETTCTREHMHDGVIYSFNADGTLAGTAKIRPGNPEQL